MVTMNGLGGTGELDHTIDHGALREGYSVMRPVGDATGTRFKSITDLFSGTAYPGLGHWGWSWTATSQYAADFLRADVCTAVRCMHCSLRRIRGWPPGQGRCPLDIVLEEKCTSAKQLTCGTQKIISNSALTSTKPAPHGFASRAHTLTLVHHPFMVETLKTLIGKIQG